MEQKPSIGRVVHYQNTKGETHAAMIVKVWTEESVNLVVWDTSGNQYIKTSVLKYTGNIMNDGWSWPPRV